MLNIKEVADNIFWFLPEFPFVDVPLNMYFIREPDAVLIEPGPANLHPAIQEAIKFLGIKKLAYIIPTHLHLDNGGGTGKMAALHPEAKVVVNSFGAKHMVDPSRLIAGTRMTWGDDFETTMGPILPVPEDRVLVAKDGEVIKLSGRDLEIIYAPGHAPHQSAILDRKVNGIFCGEALGGATMHLLPAVAPPNFDLEVYVDTINKLRSRKPEIVFYSHGEAQRNPEKWTSTAAERARMYGGLILEAFKQGKSREDVILTLRDYVFQNYGVMANEKHLYSTVEGYAVYYKKMGLIK